MTQPAPRIEDDEAEAEARAPAAAIAESDADPRTVPDEAVSVWLLRPAEGKFDAPPPEICSQQHILLTAYLPVLS
jgi:hypothetical protein